MIYLTQLVFLDIQLFHVCYNNVVVVGGGVYV